MKKKFSINTLIPILSFLILFCVFLIATRGTLVTPQNISNKSEKIKKGICG